MPKRPPRLQKPPEASGTPQVDDRGGIALHRHVDHPHELARLLALVLDLLVGDDHEVAHLADLVLGELGDRHLEHRKGGVRARQRRHVEPADLRIAQVLLGRLLGAVQQLLAIDDLQHAALVGAVGEIDAIALRPGRDGAVQPGRHRPAGARLLAGQRRNRGSSPGLAGSLRS